MIYGSVCSGIEAASVAWHPLGWRAAFLSEIEPFPRAVLAHRFPSVPLHGDFTTIQAGQYEPIELLVGGTPCQSFSIAGLRGGLADDRGNLALEYLRLADRLRPRWLVWENVPGVLSSNGGRDFGAILGGMVELGYGFAYRVLDAQHFGVPQRRRRVFVVGYLGDWRRAAAVLFERHSLQGHSPPRRETREIVAALTADGVGTCGADDNQGQAGHLIASAYVPEIVGQAMSSKWSKGSAGPAGDEHHNLIACQVTHALRGEGFDASEDGTGRGTPLGPVPIDMRQASRGATMTNNRREGSSGGAPGTGIGEPGDPSPAVSTSHVPAVAFSCKDHGADAGELAPTLRAMGHAGSHANAGGQLAVAFDTTQITSAGNYSNPKPGDPCHPLASGAHPPALAFSIMPMNSGKDYKAREVDVAQPIMGGGPVGGNQGGDYIVQSAVRRLTPRECERLQGFPDDWTLVPAKARRQLAADELAYLRARTHEQMASIYGVDPATMPPVTDAELSRLAADGPRYKALGNSMAVPVMSWIGQRIQSVELLIKLREAA